MLLFLVLAVNFFWFSNFTQLYSAVHVTIFSIGSKFFLVFKFHRVTRSYSSFPSLCALVLTLWSVDILIHHMSNSRECMGVNGEALQLHAVYKKVYRIAGKFGRNYIWRNGLQVAKNKYWRNLNLAIGNHAYKFLLRHRVFVCAYTAEVRTWLD